MTKDKNESATNNQDSTYQHMSIFEFLAGFILFVVALTVVIAIYYGTSTAYNRVDTQNAALAQEIAAINAEQAKETLRIEDIQTRAVEQATAAGFDLLGAEEIGISGNDSEFVNIILTKDDLTVNGLAIVNDNDVIIYRETENGDFVRVVIPTKLSPFLQ